MYLEDKLHHLKWNGYIPHSPNWTSTTKDSHMKHTSQIKKYIYMCSTSSNSMHLHCCIESKGAFHDHYCNGHKDFRIRSCEGNALVVAAAMSNCWDHQMSFHQRWWYEICLSWWFKARIHQMNIPSQHFLMHYLWFLLHYFAAGAKYDSSLSSSPLQAFVRAELSSSGL